MVEETVDLRMTCLLRCKLGATRIAAKPAQFLETRWSTP
jgi:hypothetical protein